MEEITPQEGRRRVQTGALLVDVREQNEFDDVHADGALLVPLSEFETRYAELPTDRELVMVCRSGARSARAGEFLQQQGYTQIANLTGGTNAWVDAGLPSVKGLPTLKGQG